MWDALWDAGEKGKRRLSGISRAGFGILQRNNTTVGVFAMASAG